MKHTKGPWKFEPETKTIRTETENYWLCTMDSFDGAVNNEANASLIAAAPEMLNALKKLLYNEGMENAEEFRAEFMSEVQKIVLKAEGGA